MEFVEVRIHKIGMCSSKNFVVNVLRRLAPYYKHDFLCAWLSINISNHTGITNYKVL